MMMEEKPDLRGHEDEPFEELVNVIDVVFVTSNDHKFKEAEYFFKKVLPSFNLIQKKFDFIEIQGPIETITRHKLGQIKQSDVRVPFFVEGNGLSIHCLGNHFPGPYIKQYLSNNSADEIWRRSVELTQSDQPAATATSCIYLCTNNPLTPHNYEKTNESDNVVAAFKFIEHVDGVITRPTNISNQSSSYSFDSFFLPNSVNQVDGTSKKPFNSLADMDTKNYIFHSHLGKCFNQLGQFLKFLYPHIGHE